MPKSKELDNRKFINTLLSKELQNCVSIAFTDVSYKIKIINSQYIYHLYKNLSIILQGIVLMNHGGRTFIFPNIFEEPQLKKSEREIRYPNNLTIIL
jgi:hypothetical protein